MTAMSVEQLFDYLNSDDFKSGENIFYNYYIYQYPAKDEYKMRRQIQEFKDKLERPTNYINAMLLDVFHIFSDYLRSETFGDQSLLDDTLEEDQTDPTSVTQELTNEANSDAFIQYVHRRIKDHLSINDGLHKPYIFVYGIGKMYPYLRTNVFLTKYEPYNEANLYKIVLFYPGEQKGNSFSLFNALDDTHTYRATLLVNR